MSKFGEVAIRSEDGTVRLKLTPAGAANVAIQDQVTQSVDLYIGNDLQSMTLATAASIDDTTVTVTTGATPTVGSVAMLKEGTSFYQGKILTVVANGGDWDLGLDTPLDAAYTASATGEEKNINMAVDGSVTPVEFDVSPSGLDAGTQWDVTRFLISILDSTTMGDGLFGGIAALTNGFVLRAVNGISKNLVNVKTNGEWAGRAFDVRYADKPPAGQFGFSVRRTYAGSSKSGIAIRFSASTNDRFVAIVQDDLTGLDDFNLVVQGHEVEE